MTVVLNDYEFIPILLNEFHERKTSKWWIQACDRKPLPGEGDTTFLPPSLWVMALPDCSLPASTVVAVLIQSTWPLRRCNILVC